MRRGDGGRFMRTLILPIIGASALAACASPGRSASWEAASPPPVERVLAPYRNGGLCGTTQEHEIVALPQSGPLPRTVRQCVPVFPEALQQREYEAECIVRFGIDDTGVPTAPKATCNTWAGAEHGPRWDAFASAAFTSLAEMSVEQSLFSSGPETGAVKVFGRRVSFRLR